MTPAVCRGTRPDSGSVPHGSHEHRPALQLPKQKCQACVESCWTFLAPTQANPSSLFAFASGERDEGMNLATSLPQGWREMDLRAAVFS